MSLAPYVRIMGRGPGRTRSLTRDEARHAMQIILDGKAAPEALGALLMLMRYRGETADEIAGFVDALSSDLVPWTMLRPALDWPSYAAGRSRGAPYFLLSAKLIAQAGYSVLVHGWNSHQNALASVSDTVRALGIVTATTAADANQALVKDGLVYVTLPDISQPAFDLLLLRDVLGLRSCINTVLRMLNPSGATASVQGVFHPSYRDLQSDAGRLLGRDKITVIKGGGGEFERHPGKDIAVHGLMRGQPLNDVAPALMNTARRLHEPDAPLPAPTDVWNGTDTNTFAEAIVCGTAGLAFYTLGAAKTIAEADSMARTFWQRRHHADAA
ncbi:glycosyl transferase family protein [Pseudaestuariivita rosea]|uniref:glycosyl transferase family protein n=1 Tax=Pseudaestuariivita rosea TaxID=2763263 RepID=UPI001ABA5AB1|nr:glycosyl transferase family protein [Pseudaestuariivita rosea]